MTTKVETRPPIGRVHRVTMSWDNLSDSDLLDLFEAISRTSSPSFFGDYKDLQIACEKYGLELP